MYNVVSKNLAPQLQRFFLLGPNGISVKRGGTTSHSDLEIKARAKLNGLVTRQ